MKSSRRQGESEMDNERILDIVADLWNKYPRNRVGQRKAARDAKIRHWTNILNQRAGDVPVLS